MKKSTLQSVTLQRRRGLKAFHGSTSAFLSVLSLLLGPIGCGGSVDPPEEVSVDEIRNGTMVSGGVHPYVQRVLALTSATRANLCTGTLIGPHQVLTAAHCFYNNGTIVEGVGFGEDVLIPNYNGSPTSNIRIPNSFAISRPADGENQLICGGDSGGPMFLRGTRELVGVYEGADV